MKPRVTATKPVKSFKHVNVSNIKPRSRTPLKLIQSLGKLIYVNTNR